MTDLPSQNSSTLSAQQQYGILRCERNAVNPLRKRHNSLLVTFLAAVYVDDRFLGLRGENVRAAHSNAVLSSRALLEHMSLRGQRLKFVNKYPLIFGNASVWFRRASNGSQKLFGEHGR